MKIYRLLHTVLLVSFITLASVSSTATAQDKGCTPPAPPTAQWIAEMTKQKHKFLVQELKLNNDQEKRFFEIYDKMESDLRDAGEPSRQAEATVRDKGDKASDAELNRAVDLYNDFLVQEAAIKKKYMAQLKTVLSGRQYYQLKFAERHFREQMFERHRELSGKKKKK